MRSDVNFDSCHSISELAATYRRAARKIQNDIDAKEMKTMGESEKSPLESHSSSGKAPRKADTEDAGVGMQQTPKMSADNSSSSAAAATTKKSAPTDAKKEKLKNLFLKYSEACIEFGTKLEAQLRSQISTSSSSSSAAAAIPYAAAQSASSSTHESIDKKQFNDLAFCCPTNEEKEHYKKRLDDYTEAHKADKDSTLIRLTLSFNETFTPLFMDGEKLFQTNAENFKGKKFEEVKNYDEEIKKWLMGAYDKLINFTESNDKTKSITQKINAADMKPSKELENIISFFQDTKGDFKEHDMGLPNNVNQEIFKPLFESLKKPMSTLIMQMQRLKDLCKAAEERREILQLAGKFESDHAPKKVERIRPPVIDSEVAQSNISFSALMTIKNCELAFNDLTRLQKEKDALNTKLNCWKAVFAITDSHPSEDELKKIEQAIQQKTGFLKTELYLASFPENLAESELPAIMFRIVILQAIDAYIQHKKSGYGLNVANNLLDTLKKTDLRDEFLNKLFTHLSREEPRIPSVPFFGTHPGNLNSDSLDTFILSAIKSNKSAMKALQTKIPTANESMDNPKLRDLIVNTLKFAPAPAPDSSSSASPSARR